MSKTVPEGSDALQAAIDNAQHAVESLGRYIAAAQALEDYIISMIAGPCPRSHRVGQVSQPISDVRYGTGDDCEFSCFGDDIIKVEAGATLDCIAAKIYLHRSNTEYDFFSIERMIQDQNRNLAPHIADPTALVNPTGHPYYFLFLPPELDFYCNPCNYGSPFVVGGKEYCPFPPGYSYAPQEPPTPAIPEPSQSSVPTSYCEVFRLAYPQEYQWVVEGHVWMLDPQSPAFEAYLACAGELTQDITCHWHEDAWAALSLDATALFGGGLIKVVAGLASVALAAKDLLEDPEDSERIYNFVIALGGIFPGYIGPTMTGGDALRNLLTVAQDIKECAWP
jgi:hypothetical protein